MGPAMKIAVIGATGLIGSKLVIALRAREQEVVAASPSSGVNTLTREGLEQALEGTDVLIDVTNTSTFGDSSAFDFFRRSGHNLRSVAVASGVRHHIALSVVGTDRLVESDYFRAKMVQENLVRSSGTPFTIVRSTQFFEFCNGIVNMAADGNVLKLSNAWMRPVAADDTVKVLTEVALGKSANDTVEVAGTELFRLDDLARTLLTANEDPRPVITDNAARYFDVELAQRTLLPDPGAMSGKTRFEDWLYQMMSTSA